jgi:hypothetical protein
MTNLFKKAMTITDLHFGGKSNSSIHNEDCLNFVIWATDEAKRQGCETCIMMGDWHNHRASISAVTLNYSIRAIEYLNSNFEQVFFIPGNHDIYYRDRRDVTSVAWAKHLANVTIVNEQILQTGDVAIVPWMIPGDEKKLQKTKARYMFGHFEFPNFLMNAKIAMPDHGGLKLDHLAQMEYVFSGHFHIRQHRANIVYTGNAFPHNYSDAWDDARGMMVLAWGETPQFFSWPDAPKYRTMKLSNLLEDPDQYLDDKTYMRVTLDKDVSYEEANFVKETFHAKYNCRELGLIEDKSQIANLDALTEIKFESVDQIVSEQLLRIQSDAYDPNLLLDIYRNL